MLKINHERILQAAIEKYEIQNGESGFAKVDVENMVFKFGGDQGDVYKVMTLGMEHFFNDVMDAECFLN